MTDSDTELMAALFVSEDGELRVEPEWEEDVTVCQDAEVWSRLTIPGPVAAGILRLIRERDEAKEAAQHFASWAMGENWALWEGARRDYPWLKEEAPPECK